MITSRIQVFTDGSCIQSHPNKPGAWAAIILLGGRKLKIAGHEERTTCNRMEIIAARNALREIEQVNGASDIVVYSDNQHVCDVVNMHLSNWVARGWRRPRNQPVKNLDLWKEIYDLLKYHKRVDFHWISSHDENFPLNDEVDKMAYQLAVSLIPDPI